LNLVKNFSVKKVIFFVFFFTNSSHANSLLDSNVEKVHHSKKKTSYRFITEKKLPFQKFLPKPLQNQKVNSPGYFYSLNSRDSFYADGYDGLPGCSKSENRIQIRSSSDGSFRKLDVIVYQFDNKKDRERAKKLGSKAIPYIEGDLLNPYRNKASNAQSIIRVLGIRCLPTRVKSIVEKGQTAFKYFEGKEAWPN